MGRLFLRQTSRCGGAARAGPLWLIPRSWPTSPAVRNVGSAVVDCRRATNRRTSSAASETRQRSSGSPPNSNKLGHWAMRKAAAERERTIARTRFAAA
jgi:hypothetical protein